MRLVTLLIQKALDGCTKENIEIEEEMILSQEDQAGPHSTEAEIAREFNIN